MSLGYLVGCVHDDHVYVSFTDNINEFKNVYKKLVLDMNNLTSLTKRKTNIDENICLIKMKALIHLFMSHMFVSVILLLSMSYLVKLINYRFFFQAQPLMKIAPL